jgi:glycine/D-amino acid oxidase-like deaminating enzyme
MIGPTHHGQRPPAVADWPRASGKIERKALVKNTPIWWEDAPPVSIAPKPVAPSCDVAIVGAGYTGLSAAITLARAGRHVQVFDKMRPGEGASSRNGGIASGNLRPPLSEMIRRFGEARAIAMQAEAKAAREDLVQFIAQEGIDCDFKLTGRFTGASSPDQYDKLRREAETLSRTLGIEAFALDRARQRDALGTDYYWGGVVRMDIGGLHPAKLLAGMLRLAQAAGADIHGETAVVRIVPAASGFEVETASGKLRARDVIVATNGYTDAANPWLRRRLVPVASCIIATEPISANLMRTLMPKGYMCSETRKLHYYYRPSPDGRRILFGGRGGSLGDASISATPRLKRALVDIFPELDDTGVTHSWFGYVAMNRDMVPRIFSHEGIHYAAGYCGSGVVWARWAGQKAALNVLGGAQTPSALDFRPPRAIPLYGGKPWFMPAVFAWYEFLDRLAAHRHR